MKSTAGYTSNPRQLSLVYNSLAQALFLVGLYVVLLFVLPVGRQMVGSHQFGALEYKILRFAVAIPSMLVWLAAFIGSSTLKHYARLIKDTPEGKYYDRLATGSLWLAWSLPVAALVSLLLSSLAYEWNGFHAVSIIITNYVALILPLVAFTIISSASRQLLVSAKQQFRVSSARLITCLFLIIGVLYCYFTFSHFNSQNLASTNNPYYLPLWLMVITVILPYLYVWFVGLLASYEITIYSRQVGGLLYKRALRYLVSGMVIIILSSIVLQYISGVEPRTGHLLLNAKLLLTVIFRVTSGIGFIALSIGALRLKKIEEV